MRVSRLPRDGLFWSQRALKLIAIILLVLTKQSLAANFNLTVAWTGSMMDSWLPRRSSITSLEDCDTAAYAANRSLCFGGLWRAKTVVDDLRSRYSNFLFVVPGGALLGSLFSQVSAGRLGQEYLDLLGVDAMALGRQEISLPAPTNLTTLRAASNSMYINSNLVAESNGQPISPMFGFATNAIFNIPSNTSATGFERVGVVAVSHADAAQETSIRVMAGFDVAVEDPVVTLRREVGKFFDQGVNKVILLQPEAGDSETIRTQTENLGVDFIASVYNRQDVGRVQGPIQRPNSTITGRPVLFSQCSHMLREICVAHLTFDDAGVLLSYEMETIRLGPNIADNATILARVSNDYNTLIAPVFDIPLCNMTVSLDSARPLVRFHEAQLGSMFADGIRWQTGADVAVINGGGIRANVPPTPGPVTVGHIYKSLPFGNLVQVTTIKGFEFWTLLENSVRWAEIYNQTNPLYNTYSSNAGRFLHLSGMRFSYCDTCTIGYRVQFIQTLRAGVWTDVDPNAMYTLAINAFMATGGDDYTFFTDPARAKLNTDYRPVRDASAVQMYLQNYAATVDPVYTPVPLGRIVRDGSRQVPVVLSVIPSVGSVFGGITVTLIGMGFDQPAATVLPIVVQIKGVDCSSPQVFNNTAMSCTLGDSTKALPGGQVPGAGPARVSVRLSPTLWRPSELGIFTYATTQADCREGTGYHVQKDQRVGCAQCPAGRYSDTDDSVNCTACPAGSVSLAGSSACTDCFSGTFASTAGLSFCAPCPPFSSTNTEREPSKKRTTCFCNPPYLPRQAGTRSNYSEPNVFIPGDQLVCDPCPAGANCLVIAGQALTAKEYWRNPATGNFLHCRLGTCCQDESCTPGDDRQCADSRQGFMCAGCKEDFNEVYGRCVDCRDEGRAGLVIFLSVLFLFLFVFFLYVRPSSDKATLKILVDYVQMLAFVVDRSTAGGSSLDIANLNPQQLFSAGIGACSLKASPLDLMAFSNVVQLGVLYAMLLIIYFLDTHVFDWCRKDAPRMRLARLINGAWLLLLFGFMGLCATAVRLLHCANLDGNNMLVQSLTIRCWSDAHLPYGIGAAIAIPILCVGVPGLVAFMARKVHLARVKRHSKLPQSIEMTPSVRPDPDWYDVATPMRSRDHSFHEDLSARRHRQSTPEPHHGHNQLQVPSSNNTHSNAQSPVQQHSHLLHQNNIATTSSQAHAHNATQASANPELKMLTDSEASGISSTTSIPSTPELLSTRLNVLAAQREQQHHNAQQQQQQQSSSPTAQQPLPVEALGIMPMSPTGVLLDSKRAGSFSGVNSQSQANPLVPPLQLQGLDSTKDIKDNNHPPRSATPVPTNATNDIIQSIVLTQPQPAASNDQQHHQMGAPGTILLTTPQKDGLAGDRNAALEEDARTAKFEDAAFGNLYRAYREKVYFFEAIYLLRRVIFILLAVLLSDVSPSDSTPKGAQANVAIVWFCMLTLLLHTHLRVYNHSRDNTLARQSLLGVAAVAAFNVYTKSDAYIKAELEGNLGATQAIFTAVVIILVLMPLAFLSRHIIGPILACCRRGNKSSGVSVPNKGDESNSGPFVMPPPRLVRADSDVLL